MLNIEDIGKPIAIVKGGKFHGTIISQHERHHDKVNRPFNHLTLPDGQFQNLPAKADKQTGQSREVVYLCGPSGSGKSFAVGKYLEEWKKMNPMGDIFIFSTLKDDPSIDKIAPIRINIGENLLENPIKAEDLDGSCCVFDDIDCIRDKDIRKEVYDLLDEILQIGRHGKGITCLVTNHLLTNGKETRIMIHESHKVIFFPFSGSSHSTNYLTNEYLGFGKDDLKKIKKTHSRWCCCYKNYPPIWMTENHIQMLAHDDEDMPTSTSMKKTKKN